MFVLTNKPETPTHKILTDLRLQPLFFEILSLDSVTPHFSSESVGAHLLVGKRTLTTQETLLVGDSPDDLTAAQSAGFNFLEAAYGCGPFDEGTKLRPWLRLKSPKDLAMILA